MKSACYFVSPVHRQLRNVLKPLPNINGCKPIDKRITYVSAFTAMKPQCLLNFFSSSKNLSRDPSGCCFLVARSWWVKILFGVFT